MVNKEEEPAANGYNFVFIKPFSEIKNALCSG